MWSTLVSNPRRGLQVLGFFILMLGVGALALPSLGRMDMRGVNILDLEFISTSAGALEQVNRLGPDGVDAAKTSLYLDFPYLITYALALSAACAVLAARAAERGSAGLAAAGRAIMWAAPVAAALDVIENVSLLRVLGGHVDQPWPALVFGAASVKFALLAVVVAYVILALALVLPRRVDEPAEPPAS
jgi:hypothetical protein